ncbi:MAG: hypothetical protein EBR82_12355 [Caulobacteraceae bacterium]|nr:hypothetical protein [Caulobacteraceae bacterium]
MATISKYFANILKEQDEPEVVAPEAPEAQADRASMEAELDKDTQPHEFDVQAVTKEQMASRKTNAAQAIELQSWVKNIDKFLEYLNSPDTNSVQTQLHMAPCDSLFEKVAKSETKKIARVCVELSGLSERLKAYLISSKSEK